MNDDQYKSRFRRFQTPAVQVITQMVNPAEIDAEIRRTLRAKGFRPEGDGALSDSWIKDEPDES